MAEIFDDIRPKTWWTASPRWSGSLPEWQGKPGYWRPTSREGQTWRDDYGDGQYIDFVVKSDRYRAGRGSAVSHIQSRLNAKRVAGAPTALQVDGVWGQKSEDMTKWFQRRINSLLEQAGSSERLLVDGLVGASTWKHLA